MICHLCYDSLRKLECIEDAPCSECFHTTGEEDTQIHVLTRIVNAKACRAWLRLLAIGDLWVRALRLQWALPHSPRKGSAAATPCPLFAQALGNSRPPPVPAVRATVPRLCLLLIPSSSITPNPSSFPNERTPKTSRRRGTAFRS